MELVKYYFGEQTSEPVMCTPIENRGMIFTDDKGKGYLQEWKVDIGLLLQYESILIILQWFVKITGKEQKS